MEEKFSKFMEYFTPSKSSKRSLAPRKQETKKLDVNIDEMLEEISNFVSSADFQKFYKSRKHWLG